MLDKFKENKNLKLVTFFPDWRTGNPYQLLLAAGIEKNNFKVSFLNYNSVSWLPINSALKNNAVPDIIHLHWINQYIESVFWSSNTLFFYLRLLLIVIDFSLLKIRGIKVVWTVHNLISHESPNQARELVARKIIARLCKVVVHSKGAQVEVSKKYNINKEKISVVPHGNYVGFYSSDQETCQRVMQKLDLDINNHVFLFLGGIRRYKGVNELVEAFLRTTDPAFNLVIAGNPFQDEDRKWLEQKAQYDSRIKLFLGYIPESELYAYINLCDVVVLPFINALTSGSAILAMSYGKALILPEKGRVFSFPDEGAIYYSLEQGLLWALEDSVNRNLEEMGASNLSFIQKLDFNTVAKILIEKNYLPVSKSEN